jgi:Tfp pilus assembly protein PilF
LFKKIIEFDSSQVRAYLALVKTLMILGESEEIAPMLHAAIEKNPQSLDLKLALVDRYLGMDKITEAKGVLLDALQHDPGNPNLQEILGTFYFRIGQMEMAESAYREAVKLSPTQVGPFMHLARFYDLNGNEDKAAQTYEQALKIAPGNVQVLDTVSRFYAHANKLELAEKYVTRALEANPSFLPSRILQTELALERGDFQTTLNLSQALLDDNQNLPKINYLRGMALLATDDLDEAEEAINAALAAWPRFVPARMGLAKVLLGRGKPDQARAHALVALDQSPSDIETRLFLGTLAETRGDLAAAEKWYREILELDPGYGPAANNLAYILVRQDAHLSEALKLATLALEKMPDDPLVLDTMGLILLRQGKAAAALDYLSRSVDQDPENPLFLYHLGLAHFQEHNLDQARQALAGALDLNATFQGQEHARDMLDRLEADDRSIRTEAMTGE